MFPDILTQVLKQQLLCFRNKIIFLSCISGERQILLCKKVCQNRVSNQQPPGQESNMACHTRKRTFGHFLNSLPNNYFLNWIKFKAFADDKLNVAKIVTYVFDRVENIMGKGENAGYQHFLLFPRCFQKAYLRVFKSQDCVVKSWRVISYQPVQSEQADPRQHFTSLLQFVPKVDWI